MQFIGEKSTKVKGYIISVILPSQVKSRGSRLNVYYLRRGGAILYTKQTLIFHAIDNAHAAQCKALVAV